MRRLTVIIGVLAAVAAAAVVATPTIVSTRLAKEEIAERISAWTGGPVTLRGEPVVTGFPSVRVVVKDVAVSSGGRAEGPPLITIPTIEAPLRILPLLMGRVELGVLTLSNPHIHLVRDEAGNGNWSAGRARRETALSAASSENADLRPSEIILRDGAITYVDQRASRTEAITAVNLRLAWQGATRAVELSGTSEWRGNTVEIDVELDDPWAAISGSGSRGRLTLAAEPAQLSQGGNLDFADPQRSTGEDSRCNPSPRCLAERLGIPIAPGSTFGPLRIDGTFEADETSVTLSDATFELDGNAAEGALALRLGGDRPMLQGSLAFDELDLGPYVKAFLPASLAELLALPVSARWLARADVDLAASADEVDLGGIRFTEAAMGLRALGGHMTLSLDKADLAGGRVEGQVAVAPANEGVAVRLSGRAVGVSVADVGGVDWTASANQLIGTDKPPQGTGAAIFDLSARGSTIGAIVASLAGWAVADVRDGSVDGADIVATLERLAGGNDVIAKGNAPFMPVAGRTNFARLTAHLAAGAGVVRAERVSIAGDRFLVTLSGEGDFKRGEMEAQGTAYLFASEPGDGGGRSRPLVELPFGVGGTMREPVVAPGIPRIRHRSDDAGNLPAGRRRFGTRDRDR